MVTANHPKTVITPTTAQTSAYLSSSSGNLSNTLYTTGTEAEIKLNEINNKMKEFHNQYGLYFITGKLTLNKSYKTKQIQAYCRNGDNKLSPKKTYKLD